MNSFKTSSFIVELLDTRDEEFKVSMEHPLTNKVEQFIFKLYKSNRLSFGNSLSYDITKEIPIYILILDWH